MYLCDKDALDVWLSAGNQNHIYPEFTLCNLVTPAPVWDLMIELAKPALIMGNAVHSIPRSGKSFRGLQRPTFKARVWSPKLIVLQYTRSKSRQKPNLTFEAHHKETLSMGFQCYNGSL